MMIIEYAVPSLALNSLFKEHQIICEIVHRTLFVYMDEKQIPMQE